MLLDNPGPDGPVVCGVVLVNAVLGGLNVLLITYLSRDRRKADVYKKYANLDVVRRLEAIEELVQNLVCKPRPKE